MEYKLTKLDGEYYLLSDEKVLGGTFQSLPFDGKYRKPCFVYDSGDNGIHQIDWASQFVMIHLHSLVIASTKVLEETSLLDKLKIEELLGVFKPEDWVFERSSGYAGYRHVKNGDWIYEEQYESRKIIDFNAEKGIDYWVDSTIKDSGIKDEHTVKTSRLCLKAGYKKALINNADKKFTLKDMEKCFSRGISFSAATVNKQDNTPYLFSSLIKSITKEQAEWNVEIEMEEVEDYIGGSGHTAYPTYSMKPKIAEGYINILKIK